MGLSSSQARLLTITARMHQIEYKAARLEAMKLQMANESRQVYEEYLNALDKTKVQMKTLTTNGAVTYVDITSLTDLKNAGFQLCRIDGDSYTPIAATATEIAMDNTSTAKKVTVINTESITNLINSGKFVLIEYGTTPSKEEDFTSVATNTGLQEVTDEIELRKAEAKYEADMKRIDMKDRRYDTELAALDSERNALKQEMETLKTVTKDNVERTFKLFS